MQQVCQWNLWLILGKLCRYRPNLGQIASNEAHACGAAVVLPGRRSVCGRKTHKLKYGENELLVGNWFAKMHLKAGTQTGYTVFGGAVGRERNGGHRVSAFTNLRDEIQAVHLGHS